MNCKFKNSRLEQDSNPGSNPGPSKNVSLELTQDLPESYSEKKIKFPLLKYEIQLNLGNLKFKWLVNVEGDH